MKVHGSVRDLYEDRVLTIQALAKQVNAAFRVSLPPGWHYESRIKALESFAVKIETGRVKDVRALEDFLACTVVVRNTLEIAAALDWVTKRFDIQYRRPPKSTATHKSADSFQFDDLRLYVVRGNDGSRPKEAIDDIVFEVQIKTFLQHAWGIATHDLTYKTDDVRWGKDRIAAHLKAAIEFAELSIFSAEMLSSSDILKLEHKATRSTADMVQIFKNNWQRADLPDNLRSLADTVRKLADEAEIAPSRIDALLKQKAAAAGELPRNLSPYAIVVQLLFDHEQVKLTNMCVDIESRVIAGEKPPLKIFITPEIVIPPTFALASYPNCFVCL